MEGERGAVWGSAESAFQVHVANAFSVRAELDVVVGGQ